MQTIKKTVRMEEFITRFPVTYPSIKDGVVSYVYPPGKEGSIMVRRNANYGLIPLGLNKNIYEACSGDTPSQYETTADIFENGALAYKTIENWFIGFNEYYSLLMGNDCRKIYESAEDYYNEVFGEDSTIDKALYIEMDAEFINHGGRGFYDWLRDYYFTSIHLIYDYDKYSQHIGKSYTEWLDFVDGLDYTTLYYPDAYKLYGRLKYLKDSGDCCLLEEFEKLGGDTMLNLLGYWTEYATENINRLNTFFASLSDENIHKIEPKISINANINSKVEDFGNFSIFSKDFVPWAEYTNGMVCTLDGEVYEYTGDTTYSSDTLNLDLGTKWRRYYDVYISKHEEERQTYETGYTITGHTVSNLDQFKTDLPLVDNIGNKLPGTFTPDENSSVIQPPEGTILGLEYKIGGTSNVDLVGDAHESATQNVYRGNILVRADIFHKDFDGMMIESTLRQCTNVNDFHAMVIESDNEADRINEGDIQSASTVTYVDFTYYMGTEFVYDDSGNTIPSQDEACVICTDHCHVEVKTWPYHISDTESYLVKYYDVIRPVTEYYSEEDDIDVSVNLCEFRMCPVRFGGVKNYACPMFRKEELLGFSSLEKKEGDIYIDRGYATALDRLLRIGETSSVEQLERYGNGIFNIIDDETQQ